jgi:3-oxoadipate enol-lactonase
MSYLKTDDREIYYTVVGSGDPVVLLHSLGGSGRDWFYQISFLVNAGYQVIVMDIAGHGASSPAKVPLTIDELMDDVVAVMNDLNLPKAHLAGVSLGGMIALMTASVHNERIDKVILINTFSNTSTEAFCKMVPDWIAQLQADNGVVKWFESGWQMQVNQSFSKSPDGQQAFLLYHSQAALNNGISVANILKGITGIDITSNLAKINAPVLLMGGSEDPTAEMMKKLVDQLPSAKYINVEGGRHLAQIDSSSVVNIYIDNFFNNRM